MQSCEKNYEREVMRKSPLAPTFFVGFAFHETYDDLVTAQKMICYKRSPQGSNDSITPKNSITNVPPGNNAQNSDVTDILESLVMDIAIDANDRKGGSNTEKDVSEITDYVVVNKREIEPKQLRDIHRNSIHSKKMRPRKTKKEKRYKYIDKLKKNVYNKNKEEKTMNKKLEQYFLGKTVNLTELSDKINAETISHMVSRSKMLKKVSAKESLIEYQDFKDNNIEKRNEGSESASFMTANESFFSYSSQDTLTNKESRMLPDNGDVSQSDSAESVVLVSPDPFQATTINVSRAAVTNATFVTEHDTTFPSQEFANVTHDLTSTEAVNLDKTLTSGSPSETSSKINSDSYSDSKNNTSASETTLSLETLTGTTRISTTEVSDYEYDTFFNEKSSYFDKVDLGTSPVIAVPVERNDVAVTPEFATADLFPGKTLFLDTVMKLEMFPEMSHNKLEYPFDVIIADKFIQSNPNAKEVQRIGDDTDDQSNYSKIVSRNITQKEFIQEQHAEFKKMNVNLPCEAEIKYMLKENEKPMVKKHSDDFVSGNPSSLSELWERLLIALDSTARSIEDRLSEKIINEMKECMSILDYYKPSIDTEAGTVRSQVGVSNDSERRLSSKGINVDEVISRLDQDLQCCLVQNDTIDELLLKMEPGGAQLCLPTISLHKGPKYSKTCFKTIKPEVAEPEEKGITITLSTETLRPSVKRWPMFRLMKASDICFFLRENVFVLTSVPIFFAVFIVFYVVIIFVINPF